MELMKNTFEVKCVPTYLSVCLAYSRHAVNVGAIKNVFSRLDWKVHIEQKKQKTTWLRKTK